MYSIFLSVLVFGLVHPISKVILDSGIPLSYFCILYVGIRLIIQIPFIVIKKEYKIQDKMDLLIFVGFGLIGASLQFFEFKAIEVGLSPGTVTFLMFTYPIWISLFKFIGGKNDDKINLSIKLIFALAGMFLVSNATLDEILTSSVVYPILAGISIALWIIVSNKLRTSGYSSIKISVYYDFFSLVFLIINFSESVALDFYSFKEWISMGNTGYLIMYSLLVGLLPNILFYYGNKLVDTITSGMIVALEPIVSTIYSCLLFGFVMSENFLIGAFLIFMANIPSVNFQKLLKYKV